MAFVGFLLFVVVDAHEQQVAGVLPHLVGVLLALDLLDGTVRILVVLQFDDQCWLIHVLTRDKHQVGIALTRCQLSMDDVVVGSIIVGDG